MYKYSKKNPIGRDVEDCVLRSISLAEGKSWRETYRELSELAIDEGLMLNSVEFVEEYLDKRYDRQCHTAKTVEEFANEHRRGRYLVTMPNHITCIIDGVIYDTFNPAHRIMRCAWRVK